MSGWNESEGRSWAAHGQALLQPMPAGGPCRARLARMPLLHGCGAASCWPMPQCSLNFAAGDDDDDDEDDEDEEDEDVEMTS
jgi:hypothetical protein